MAGQVPETSAGNGRIPRNEDLIPPSQRRTVVPPRPPAELLLFDPDWYRRAYPDIAGRGVDPVQHYLEHGAAEGRDPNPFFSTKAYLFLNPDVQRAGMNPFLHFILYGCREGRIWKPVR